MKRLLYAPKAYVFIRSSNMDGRIYDVSTDCVAGSVTRNVNDLSKAEITLRNRFKKWLRDPDTKKQLFLPMDMITIWLQRIAGHPIQVFTGYLDSAPMYQGYPGDCKLTASCTLKKLAYTWFDPGLDFFTQWINHMDGWVYNPATGEAQNPKYLTKGQSISNDSFDAAATAPMHDGSFAKLLNDFMVLIAGWEQQDVIVSDLPKHLPQVAARLHTDINNNANVALAALEEMMAQIMGMGLNVDLSNNATNVVPPTAVGTINQIKANAGNVPTAMLLFAALALTGFQANYSVDQNASKERWGYGIYGLRPQVPFTPGTDPGIPGLTSSIVPGLEATTPASDYADVGVQTQNFVKMLNAAGWGGRSDKHAAWVLQALNGDVSGMITWIEKARGYAMPKNQNVNALLDQAKQYDGVSFNTDNSAANPVSNGSDPAKTSFSDPRLSLSPNEVTTLAKNYTKTQLATPWLAWALEQAHQISGDLELVTPPTTSSPVEAIYITGPAPKLRALYNRLKGMLDIDRVRANVGGSSMSLRSGTVSTETANTLPSNTMEVFWPSTPVRTPAPSTTADTGNDPSGNTDPVKLTLENLAAFSANSAFAAHFSFPTNYLESRNLTGDKALMNDVSCFDAAKQFAQASMRNFMSLPDGRFLAFYPDYFGTTRGPYWYVYDIEITNLGIQVNDEALATHVYVVGDTFALDGQVDWMDELSTRGVATVTQAMMLESFIETYSTDSKGNIRSQKLGRLEDAYAFLQHYGARPHKEEYPIIRNSFFEFLMAWQRFMQLWAAQFATEVTFTFQPEVMAGGILGFPDHGLQMYCESVTHSWDYSSGFETNATLSSPALLHGAKAPDGWAKPGFALAGNVNTVGAA